jgi:serine/threonine protein kinase
MKKSRQSIGKYVIERPLGQGAMGTVYLGFDPGLERHAAIKLMNTGLKGDESLKKRFFLEARSVAKLSHPNIIQIWDLGVHEDDPYIAMEYIEGEDLKTLIEKKVSLPLGQKLEIIIQVCRGLDHAHRKGIIHRDIKPGNIRITPAGEPKILDFGLARPQLADASMYGAPVGSPYYMSPEQWNAARDLDGRSDLFSAAVVLYELTTYMRPFEADEIPAIRELVISQPHLPILQLLPACATELSDAIDKALSKQRQRRFASCGEFADALESLQSSIQSHQKVVLQKTQQIQSDIDKWRQRWGESWIAELL